MFTKKLIISHEPGPDDTMGVYAIHTIAPGMGIEDVGNDIIGGLLTYISKMKSEMSRQTDLEKRARMRKNYDTFAIELHKLIDEIAKIDD